MKQAGAERNFVVAHSDTPIGIVVGAIDLNRPTLGPWH